MEGGIHNRSPYRMRQGPEHISLIIHGSIGSCHDVSIFNENRKFVKPLHTQRSGSAALSGGPWRVLGQGAAKASLSGPTVGLTPGDVSDPLQSTGAPNAEQTG